MNVLNPRADLCMAGKFVQNSSYRSLLDCVQKVKVGLQFFPKFTLEKVCCNL